MHLVSLLLTMVFKEVRNNQLCFAGGPEEPGLSPPGSVGQPRSGAAGNEAASSAPGRTGISSGSSKMLLKCVE
ncbi:hypothetical protein MUG91_G18n116 [Manis pentadactyla]|nr:hypothetical protein MUG91_G18n116 [Manis pentadactyla]